jgi:hypothetical protein
LGSVTNLASSGFIKIDNEIILYQYLNVSTNSLGGCARGQANTTAAAHTAVGITTLVYVPNVPCVTVWPTPDGSQPYQFVYWRLRRIQDAGDGVNTFDVPFRMIPCLAAGLAYYLALKIPGADARLPVLKQQYDEAWEMAATEDREKAAQRFVPRRMFIT